MGKHKGRGKQASHRHKLSKSSRFEASFNGTGDLEGFEKDITRGKLYQLCTNSFLFLVRPLKLFVVGQICHECLLERLIFSYKVRVSFRSISGDREPKDYDRGFPFPLAMWVSLHVL